MYSAKKLAQRRSSELLLLTVKPIFCCSCPVHAQLKAPKGGYVQQTCRSPDSNRHPWSDVSHRHSTSCARVEKKGYPEFLEVNWFGIAALIPFVTSGLHHDPLNYNIRPHPKNTNNAQQQRSISSQQPISSKSHRLCCGMQPSDDRRACLYQIYVQYRSRSEC